MKDLGNVVGHDCRFEFIACQLDVKPEFRNPFDKMVGVPKQMSGIRTISSGGPCRVFVFDEQEDSCVQ